jgi:UDP-glucose 4-epimerase
MNILVTGGAGFIGKYLVKFLLEKENSVTIFDNFSNSSEKSINFLTEMGAKIVKGDITNIKDLENVIENYDTIIHLAAQISVLESIKNPDKTFQVNVEGTNNVLSICKKNFVKKIVIASSAAVYGESSQNNQLKEESQMEPISPYGESKMKMEQNIIKFANNNKIDYVILRFFNIYGIGQSPEYAGVITKFLKNIINEESLKIFGDGLQTRDFVAIHDVIQSIYNALICDKNGVFNIASGEKITIKELAKQMITLSGKTLEIQFLAEKQGDIRHSQANIERSKNQIAYSPKWELKEGIKELL